MRKPKIGQVVAIEWLDHFVLGEENDGVWITLKQEHMDRKMRMLTYGRVVGEDPHHWIIAGTDADLDNPKCGVYSDVNKILKSAVVGCKKLL